MSNVLKRPLCPVVCLQVPIDGAATSENVHEACQKAGLVGPTDDSLAVHPAHTPSPALARSLT